MSPTPCLTTDDCPRLKTETPPLGGAWFTIEPLSGLPPSALLGGDFLADFSDEGEEELVSHFRGGRGREEAEVTSLDHDSGLGVLVAESHELLEGGGHSVGGFGSVDVHMLGLGWVWVFWISLGAIRRQ